MWAAYCIEHASIYQCSAIAACRDVGNRLLRYRDRIVGRSLSRLRMCYFCSDAPLYTSVVDYQRYRDRFFISDILTTTALETNATMVLTKKQNALRCHQTLKQEWGRIKQRKSFAAAFHVKSAALALPELDLSGSTP